MQDKNTTKIITGIIIVLAAMGIIGYATAKKDGTISTQNDSATTTREQVEAVATSSNSAEGQNDVNSETTSKYKNGTYTVIGEYRSPGGPEGVDVTLVLENDIVVDATVVSRASLPASVNFQGKFISGYKEFVVGKNIDEINLSAVSGSSLTPKGFNDAVAKIKADARA